MILIKVCRTRYARFHCASRYVKQIEYDYIVLRYTRRLLPTVSRNLQTIKRSLLRVFQHILYSRIHLLLLSFLIYYTHAI